MYHLRILLIIILLGILIFLSQKEKFTTSTLHPTRKWWNRTATTARTVGATRTEIQNQLRTTCPPNSNQYQEKADLDLKTTCLATNNKYFTDGKIVNFNKELGEGSTEFDIMDGVTIESQVVQEPSERMKNPGPEYGDDTANPRVPMEDLLVNNNYNFVAPATSFNSLADFYRFQLCKKMDKDENQKQKFIDNPKFDQNEVTKMYLGDVTIGTQRRDGFKKKYHVTGTNDPNKKKKINTFNDLFGEPHHEQGKTTWVVSRGYTTTKDYLNNEASEPLGNRHNQEKPNICKECPVATIQNYDFNLGNPLVFGETANVLSQEEIDARRGKYLVEKGGTKYNPNTNECELCSFQDGCFSPHRGRVDKFQTKSCVGGQDRVCQTCKVCQKGYEKIITFCGEGGANSDAECGVCAKCTGEYYKVDGCNIDNTIKDTVCEKKTQCRGADSEPDNPEKRTYEIYAGYNGSEPGEVVDINGNTVNLETPFYGHDRICAPCDICPPGFKSISGCQTDNDKSNNICQRVINIKEILRREIVPAEGFFYDTTKVQKYLTACNAALEAADEIKRNEFLAKAVTVAEKIRAQQDINKPESVKYDDFKDITFTYNGKTVNIDLSDDNLLAIAKTACSTCGSNTYRNPANPGCVGRSDTICIPHTRCDPKDMIKIPGTPTSDVVCGPCRCPEGEVRNPSSSLQCNGVKNISGCMPNESCTEKQKKIKAGQSPNLVVGFKKGETDVNLFSYDKPSAYGDFTHPDKCKVCEEECPPGKFQIGKCEPDGSTDLLCKDHTKCHPETQITLEPGTATKDTICQCIDGYEWDVDDYGLADKSKPCVKIEGVCHTSPCHPNAVCYDNFDSDNKFIDFSCLCDINNNYIETEKQGVGPEGCVKLSDTHFHPTQNIDTDILSAPQISDYQDLIAKKPKVLSIMAHTKGLENTAYQGHFHDGDKPHIHK